MLSSQYAFCEPSLVTGDNIISNQVEIDTSSVAKIFKYIKNKTDSPESLVVEHNFRLEIPFIEWKESDEFMDNIKYYRILQKKTQRQISKYIGSDPETYRQYELKNFDIQDPIKAEKMIEFLNLEQIVELPDYFKIKKKYDSEKIKEMVMNVGIDNFSKETGISKYTLSCWLIRDSYEISTYTYKRLVDYFKNNNIEI